ncbi:type III-A CRISPR-associated protein Csm2 [Desulfovibrio sp. ZJ200]|uniref:type III-A CRISPR-associated protein Csm2 n=1 Tax=Desulfovibrio sp. ZJ200 TaxID=2709792 RepID=UPI0013EB2A51|nr:type III-A CRISPR-associated protein Csm2 [Desulfovibrio sp. ZJ200]
MSKIEYYKDKAKQELNPVWVDSRAEETARSFTERPEIKTSQLRRFYADVKSLERQLLDARDEQAAFCRILPMIKLLKAKSEYALKRKVVPESFKTWLWKNVDSIEDVCDFKAFLLHFEAVVGFSARYLKD